ncbi:MAG: TlpA family protein disulfide reductase [Helicobacteraceae bacterium]|jgi:thiol-disulfide isomerase/thioredoxin|nr:TlpA family protein disulfide reductase [Helicobacteraceae bacterium]
MKFISAACNFILILSIAFFFGACDEQKRADITSRNGFEIKTLEGETKFARVEASDGRYNNLILEDNSKPTLYVFFLTDCPECKKEFPHLIDMYNRYKGKVEIIGVLVESKSSEDAVDFVASYQINFPVVLGAGAYRLADAVGGVKYVPAIHIYDSAGRYVSHFVGAAPQEMLESRVNGVITE